MSFFIRNKSKNGNFSKKITSDKHSRKRKAAKELSKNDDVTSSEEDEIADDLNNHASSSEDEYETAQEKKLRLAKVYLEEIEKAEKRKLEDQALDEACKGDLIEKRLKEDYLKQQGKLRCTVAENYIGVDAENVLKLKCKEHKNTVTCVCVSSDNQFIFSGSKDGGVVKWSLQLGKKLSSLPFIKQPGTKITGHSESILSIAISSDNKFLAIGDLSSDIQIWNPDNLTHIHTLSGHRGGVTGLAFRKETHTLYSSSKDKSVKVWSLDEMSYVETMYGHLDGITSIDSLQRERAVTSGGRDMTIRIWKIPEESQLIFNFQGGSIDCVRLINEDNFVTGGDDGQLSIWGMNKKKPLCFVKQAHGLNATNNQPNWISSVASLQNTDLISSGSNDGLIKLWHLGPSFKTISLLFSFEVIGFVNAMNFTSEGKFLVAAIGTEHRYGRWDVIKTAKNGLVVIPLNKNK